jgi:hypothetical protein
VLIARIVSASIRDKDNNRLLHDEIIPYGCNPSDAPCDLTCFIDGVLGINEAAQLDDALASFDTDLEGLEKIICCKQILSSS